MSAARFELPHWECLALLRGETVGRLCVVDQGYPLAFPINYRLIGERDDVDVAFRTIAHATVARYEGPASLEVDRIDQNTAWSVIVRGDLRRVVGDHELPDPHPLVTEGRHQWIRLHVTSVSGRRFTSRFTGMAPDAGPDVDWQPLDPERPCLDPPVEGVDR